jgi:Uri superfamily endonuclease
LKGTYLLILQLDSEIAALRVGRLGLFTFAAGHYLYVGSAFGPGGLPARLAYHERRDKARPHWHIDYLRAHTPLCEAWAIGYDVPIEQALVAALTESPGLSIPAPGFGASDSGRRSHLLYSPRVPQRRMLMNAVLAAAESGGAYSRRLTIDIHSYNGA